MYIGTYKGYKIYVSDKKNKKYYALVDGKKIHFGDKRYQHYKDIFGYYKKLDHNDNDRRNNFLKRFERFKNKPGTAGWFAINILW